MPPPIGDYYRAVIEQVKAEIESSADDRVLGMNPDEWVDHLVSKFGLEVKRFRVSARLIFTCRFQRAKCSLQN